VTRTVTNGPFGLQMMNTYHKADGDDLYIYTDQHTVGNALERGSYQILAIRGAESGKLVADAYATDPKQVEQAARWLLDFFVVRG